MCPTCFILRYRQIVLRKWRWLTFLFSLSLYPTWNVSVSNFWTRMLIFQFLRQWLSFQPAEKSLAGSLNVWRTRSWWSPSVFIAHFWVHQFQFWHDLIFFFVTRLTLFINLKPFSIPSELRVIKYILWDTCSIIRRFNYYCTSRTYKVNCGRNNVEVKKRRTMVEWHFDFDNPLGDFSNQASFSSRCLR